MKLTYAQQLKHPQWQRRRLEALEAARFSCANCGDTEATLHVHHKRYVKGRQVWEYELDELEVLCEACHEATHFLKDRLDRMFMDGPKAQIASLVAGYMSYEVMGYEIDPGMIEEIRQSGDERTFVAGVIASWLDSTGPTEMLNVLELIHILGPDPQDLTVLSEMRERLRAHFPKRIAHFSIEEVA